jgi:hypothetical protein
MDAIKHGVAVIVTEFGLDLNNFKTPLDDPNFRVI